MCNQVSVCLNGFGFVQKNTCSTDLWPGGITDISHANVESNPADTCLIERKNPQKLTELKGFSVWFKKRGKPKAKYFSSNISC